MVWCTYPLYAIIRNSCNHHFHKSSWIFDLQFSPVISCSLVSLSNLVPSLLYPRLCLFWISSVVRNWERPGKVYPHPHVVSPLWSNWTPGYKPTTTCSHFTQRDFIVIIFSDRSFCSLHSRLYFLPTFSSTVRNFVLLSENYLFIFTFTKCLWCNHNFFKGCYCIIMAAPSSLA